MLLLLAALLPVAASCWPLFLQEPTVAPPTPVVIGLYPSLSHLCDCSLSDATCLLPAAFAAFVAATCTCRCCCCLLLFAAACCCCCLLLLLRFAAVCCCSYAADVVADWLAAARTRLAMEQTLLMLRAHMTTLAESLS